MDKEELRALYRQIRLRMSGSEVSSKSRMIGRRLLNDIDWPAYEHVCAYSAIDGLNEVDLRAVTSKLKAQGLNVELVLAAKNPEVPTGAFDVILVPCLVFDEQRYRLGWGGGWYDKFLAQQPRALKVGVAYRDSLIPSLPHEPHDIPLDMIITEDQVY